MQVREHGSPSPGIKPVLSGSGTNPCGSCMQLNVQKLHGAERIPVEGYPHVSDLLARASAGLVPVGINPQKRTRPQMDLKYPLNEFGYERIIFVPFTSITMYPYY